ncbi:S26 family signal peptidase [Mesorhizobium intechi]|uniref:S26 family signal peptidase n=1 Tax=Mesorhizobium intechi TaxID=537601 RepID=UPI00142EA2EE|nr:S26 family signal peptidase [Mesorhizobium intechi]
MTGRGTIVVAMLAGATLSVSPALSRHAPWLIWNASASVPIGLYRIEPGRTIGVGDLAVVMPPEPLADFLAERRYLPRGVPLLKHVLALGGETVCRRGSVIIARGKTYGYARERDTEGRWLPVWQGCRVLADGEVFLMNGDIADSFDGRYFGPLPLTAIVGRAVPVWTRMAHLRHRMSPENRLPTAHSLCNERIPA